MSEPPEGARWWVIEWGSHGDLDRVYFHGTHGEAESKRTALVRANLSEESDLWPATSWRPLGFPPPSLDVTPPPREAWNGPLLFVVGEQEAPPPAPEDECESAAELLAEWRKKR